MKKAERRSNMYYKLYFNSIAEANAFIDRINTMGIEWHPEHLSDDTHPVLQFECSKASFEAVEKAYYGE
jgi:gamma-glutamyl-gamma-aminobutyrate hydrolase PuuD